MEFADRTRRNGDISHSDRLADRESSRVHDTNGAATSGDVLRLSEVQGIRHGLGNLARLFHNGQIGSERFGVVSGEDPELARWELGEGGLGDFEVARDDLFGHM